MLQQHQPASAPLPSCVHGKHKCVIFSVSCGGVEGLVFSPSYSFVWLFSPFFSFASFLLFFSWVLDSLSRRQDPDFSYPFGCRGHIIPLSCSVERCVSLLGCRGTGPQTGNWSLFSHLSGGWKSKLEVLAALFSPEASLCGLPTAAFSLSLDALLSLQASLVSLPLLVWHPSYSFTASFQKHTHTHTHPSLT